MLKPSPTHLISLSGQKIETAKRRDGIAKRMLNTPPKPPKEKDEEGMELIMPDKRKALLILAN